MMKTILFLMVIISMFGVATINVFASGPAYDYDEKYENVPGAPECWYDGYADGQNDKFDQDRNEECGPDKGDQYYRAFIFGCKDAGNTQEACERFIE